MPRTGVPRFIAGRLVVLLQRATFSRTVTLIPHGAPRAKIYVACSVLLVGNISWLALENDDARFILQSYTMGGVEDTKQCRIRCVTSPFMMVLVVMMLQC